MRAAHLTAYFYLNKLNLNCNDDRLDKVALRTTCIINVKLKIIKIRTGCVQDIYFYYSANLTGLHKTFDWAHRPRVGHSCSKIYSHFYLISLLYSANNSFSFKVTISHLRITTKFQSTVFIQYKTPFQEGLFSIILHVWCC